MARLNSGNSTASIVAKISTDIIYNTTVVTSIRVRNIYIITDRPITVVHVCMYRWKLNAGLIYLLLMGQRMASDSMH